MMGSLKISAVAAMAASLLVVTALGSDAPGAKTKTATKAPAPVAGRSCCDRGDGAAAILLARAGTAAEEPTAKKARKEPGPETKAKGVATRKALLAQVTAMLDDGVADCCTEPGCAFCVIAADQCGCGASLEKGGPVCPECWGGWQAGQGMVSGVKPEAVKMVPKATLEKLYGMKADKLDEAGGN